MAGIAILVLQAVLIASLLLQRGSGGAPRGRP